MMTLFAMIVCLALLATVAYFVLLLAGETLVWLVSRVMRRIEDRRGYPLQPSASR